MKGGEKVNVQIKKHEWLKNWKIRMANAWIKYMGRTWEKRLEEYTESISSGQTMQSYLDLISN